MRLSAIAAAILALPAVAGAGDDTAAESEWLGLDREVERLARAEAERRAEGPHVSFQFQTVFRAGDGGYFGEGPRFEVERTRFGLEGEVHGFDYRIRIQTRGDRPAQFSTARIRTEIAPSTRLSVGRLKPSFYWGSLVSRPNLLFVDRTIQGAIWVRRDVGLRLDGSVGPARWYGSMQNGGDGIEDRFLWTGRVEVSLAGDPGRVTHEGAPPGATDQLQIAAGFADEGSIDDGTVWAIDLVAVHGPLFLQAGWLDYGSGFVDGAVDDGGARATDGQADRQPLEATAAWRVTDDWDVASRFEWTDDDDDTWVVRLGANRYYLDRTLKWQADLALVESEDDDPDGGQVSIGLWWAIG